MPAALTGFADYGDAHEEQQRIGVVHAAMNSAALLFYLVYLGSLTLRAWTLLGRCQQTPGFDGPGRGIRQQPGGARMLARVVEITVWWAVLLLVWLATLNAFSFAELGTAAGLAVPCAFAARAGRIAAGVRWRVLPRWARWLLLTPWAILHDTVSVLLLALRPDRPDEDSIDAIELDGHEAGHEALATVVLSTSPGSVVVDADEDRLLVHRLPIGDTGLSKAVRR